MDEIVRQAVARAIVTMRDNLGERLTIDDLARAAMFSKFHFTRVFLRVTGLSPGRFLSALRLAEAKRLLATTVISVADISHQVGYNSVGTFSARFSSSVGVSPSGYRHLHGTAPRITDGQAPGSGATVRGQLRVSCPADVGPVFVGLFAARIAEGAPARCAILPAPGPYALADVPQGSWYVLTHAYGTTPQLDNHGLRPFTGLTGPVTVHRGVAASLADVRLRPRHGFDPPVLLALPDLRHAAVARPLAS